MFLSLAVRRLLPLSESLVSVTAGLVAASGNSATAAGAGSTRSLSVLATASASSSSSASAFNAASSQPQQHHQFHQHQQQQQQHHHHHHHQQQQQQYQQRRSLHLTPREIDHLQLHQCGKLAQERLARGVRLNVPESIALITSVMMERIRDGKLSVAELMTMGQSLLGRNQVMTGVPDIVKDVQIEATFPDGTKLLTVHSPISKLNGDLNLALEGTFLPVPDMSVFVEGSTDDDGADDEEALSPPGAVTTLSNEASSSSSDAGITINKNRSETLVELSVTNTGDRPIQVGSHYAFLETNRALEFDRLVSIGKRLNIPSGASVRFEPGEIKTVTLVDIGGTKNVVSGNRLHSGSLDSDVIMGRVQEQGFKHATAMEIPPGTPLVVSRSTYADMYGPTTGDKIKLGDTSLQIEVEDDLTTYGEECKFGGGKTLREGMGQVRFDAFGLGTMSDIYIYIYIYIDTLYISSIFVIYLFLVSFEHYYFFFVSLLPTSVIVFFEWIYYYLVDKCPIR